MHPTKTLSDLMQELEELARKGENANADDVEVWFDLTSPEAILSLLSSIRAELEWRPIKTAPMDGTLVELYWPNGFVPEGRLSGYKEWPDEIHCCVGKWISDHRGGNWVVPLINAYFGVPSDPSCNLDFIEVEPTHWRPLPPPPSAEE